MRPDRLTAVVLGVVAAGCAAHSSRHAARTLAPGGWRTVVAVDGLGFEHGREYMVYPVPEVGVRRGMGPGWDLGGKLGAGTVEASARFAVVARDDLAVAIAPGLRAGFAAATNNRTDVLRATAFAHAVVERNLGRRTALVGTATAAITAAGPDHHALAPWRALVEPAVGAGVRIRLGRRVLWPELTVTLPWAPAAGIEPPLVQAGIGLEL